MTEVRREQLRPGGEVRETPEGQFRRMMPEDEGLSSLNHHEAVAYGEPDRTWPVWSQFSAEQWREAHGEDFTPEPDPDRDLDDEEEP